MSRATLIHRRTFLGAAALACSGAHAQGLFGSSRPMSFIVPYPAGGPADVTARQLEAPLSKVLGRTLVIDNVAGAGGSIGIQKLLAAPPDGQQLMIGTPSDVILSPLAMASVKHRPEQLRMLGLASTGPLMLVSGPQLKAATLEDVVALARKPQGAQAAGLTYGSIGLGSLYHLVMEDFAIRAKLPLTHAPYKGVSPLVQDLMGGQVDLAILPAAGNVVDLVLRGKLRAYAITDIRRLDRLPAAPTFAEVLGYKDFVYEIWGGLFVPRTVPLDVAQRLNDAISQAVQDAEFRRQIALGGAVAGSPMTLDDGERMLTEQTARYRRLAQAVKLVPQ